MTEVLNWMGLSALVIGCGCFGLIGIKRSAWWGPSKSIMENLDSIEIIITKTGFISLLLSIILFVI